MAAHSPDATQAESAPSPGRIPLKLVVLTGPDAGREHPLERALTVGSGPEVDVRLDDPAVSRTHARFAPGGAHVTVTDLGSRNGTFQGSTRVGEAQVPVGTVLRVGRTEIAVQPRWYLRELSPSTATRFGPVIGVSRAMREIFAVLERVAGSDLTVLIEGESGTGKEVFARAVHEASPRRDWPYVVFDCSAVPRELAESELFGHKKGAFSGAVESRAGAFARAHGGTLFLDELGELPLDLQPKLLRALETGEIRAVGDDAPRKLDVRVVAATNRDLSAEVARGNFRADLLYRLDVARVRVPPLRARPDDVPVLARHLLTGRIQLPPASEGGDEASGALHGENLARLLAYSWPGNVRELRNVLHRAAAIATVHGRLPRFEELVINLGAAGHEPATLGAELPGVAAPMPYKDAKAALLERFERAYVTALLARHRGNVAEAARAAGLSRKHLYELARRVTDELPDDEDAER